MKPDNPSFISGTHQKVEREKGLRKLSFDLQVYVKKCMAADTLTIFFYYVGPGRGGAGL